MNQNELKEINRALAVTAEICGTELSETAVRVIIKRLSAYPFASVHNALKKCMDEVTGRLTLAHIKQRLDDGRPSPEIAWSQIPKDERDSKVLTSEQKQALKTVSAMIDQGELIPARMAFIEKYKELVAESRANDEPVRYELEMGFDSQGRYDAAKVGIDSGQLERKEAIRLLPEFKHEIDEIPMLPHEKEAAAMIGDMVKQIANK
jgi:hypothetical protein